MDVRQDSELSWSQCLKGNPDQQSSNNVYPDLALEMVRGKTGNKTLFSCISGDMPTIVKEIVMHSMHLNFPGCCWIQLNLPQCGRTYAALTQFSLKKDSSS